MIGNWVRNCGSISILSISILGAREESPVLSLKDRTRPRRRTIVPSKDHCEVHPTNYSLFSPSVHRWTSTTDHHALDGSSCTTIMVVRDPILKGLKIFSKCPMTDLYDGPSCSRQFVLHNCPDC